LDEHFSMNGFNINSIITSFEIEIAREKERRS